MLSLIPPCLSAPVCSEEGYRWPHIAIIGHGHGTADSMPVHRWMKNIWARQPLKEISLSLNQKMPSILGMVDVDRPRSIDDRMARK